VAQSLIMRDRSITLTDAEKQAARKALEQGLRGIDEQNHKSWMRFIRNIFSLEDGEIVEVGTRIPRSGPFHRFHMLCEQTVFNAQERFKEFEQFRNWLKIGSGFVTWVPGVKGGIVPLPNSISYAKLEEDAMRELHNNMIKFLHDGHAAPYLWKHLSAEDAGKMMKTVLERLDR